ncbi:MAG TPA: hypothetical protein PLM93_09930 [Sulfuricurvum sp.]|nr:MAG: hypothetical protein B7Y30_03620 [Campylobacterales bacterium 16-40-21]OZA02599.1 MAG: hypothetical protein B7X89_08650 [Sulfuricurvum sp. 17-40-25]HQS67487.1 hypothetical protein [Sulfuricurvum sp.]HQT36327.1 hypothetical protein [Sulfuricurvum sp.]
MLDWKQTVSAPATTVNIGNIASYVCTSIPSSSPIDNFYNERNKLLSAVSPTYATSHPTVIPLILVGMISITENYFRELLAGIITLCPVAKEKSSSKALNLATIWFGYSQMEKGAFENISFSDVDAVKKAFQSFIGYEIKPSNQLIAPLNEFGKLCELRHAIVHSASILAGKNAIKLQLPGSGNPVRVQVGFSELQEAAEVCTSLICAVNLDLFELLSRRWLFEWPGTPAYIGQDMNQLFRKVWNLFYSNFDATNGLISQPLTYVKTKNLIISTNAS